MTLARLRAKYLQLRAVRAAGEPDREVLRALAREFPGSLAELDRLPPETLEERIRVLGELVDRGAPDAEAPAWARGWQLAHPALRGALLAKAWLAGRRRVDADARAEFAATIPTLPWPEDARRWIDRLDELADPPEGRLVALVFREVGKALGLSDVAEVREVLMPRR